MLVYLEVLTATQKDWTFLSGSFPARTPLILQNLYEMHKTILPARGLADKDTAATLYDTLQRRYAGNDTKSAPKKKRGRPTKQQKRKGSLSSHESAASLMSSVDGMSALEETVASVRRR